MRRDSIFFQLFQQSPTLLFQLVDSPPQNAEGYRFESMAVKETAFTIDGVFLPPEMDPPGIVFLCEVQFQKDNEFYERLFAETFAYFRRHRSSFSDWRAVIIYPSRSTEQVERLPYDFILESHKVYRIYLKELGEINQLPLGTALMVLTTLSKRKTPQAARDLLTRAQTEVPPSEARGIIEMITTILVYRFTNLSREEIETMLGITLQETRFYQEAKDEGRVEGERRERALILRQLTHRFSDLPASLRSQAEQLSLEQLEALGEALLDFQEIPELERWLAEN